MDQAQRQRLGILLALAAALLWGVSGAVAADAFSDVSPARVAQARAAQATLILMPLAWYRGILHPQGDHQEICGGPCQGPRLSVSQ